WLSVPSSLPAAGTRPGIGLSSPAWLKALLRLGSFTVDPSPSGRRSEPSNVVGRSGARVARAGSCLKRCACVVYLTSGYEEEDIEARGIEHEADAPDHPGPDGRWLARRRGCRG